MSHIKSGMSFAQRKKANTQYFKEHIAPLKDSWYKIDTVSLEAIQAAKELEDGFHKEKPKEANHKADSFGQERRFKYGPRCEALCKDTFNALSSFDKTVGDSRDYGDADFKKIGVGVKSAQFGSVAMVYREPKNPEIIMSYTDDGEYYICGLATLKVIRKYASEDFLNDTRPAHKLYAQKLGFYGYDKLIPLQDHLTLPKLIGLLKEIKNGGRN